MWTILLITLAAIFKAVADTLDDHFDTSIFRSKDPLVWDANHSTVRKWWITNYKPDPWHICNSLMIVCLFACIVIQQPFFIKIGSFELEMWGGFAFILYGVWFNIVFELFYSKWLRK